MSAVPITADEYVAQCIGTRFEDYESKVASWLDGELPPQHTPAFDVYHCKAFPSLTFQVKYANFYKYGGSAARHMSSQWVFHQAKWHDVFPHYFVLFGISEDGSESCFCMDRHTFKKHAAVSQKRGGRIMQVSPNRVVTRGSGRRSYVYQPWIWDYEVKDPQRNLVSRIQELDSWKQLQLP